MAHLEMRAWEIRRERIARATDFRAAMGADKKAWEKFITALERDPPR